MAEAEARPGRLTAVVVMGVSGSGKTTIGRLLAARLGWQFQEGDDLHPPANIARMAAGLPLGDAERWPWLQRIAECIAGWRAAGVAGVISCSALKRSYRRRLGCGNDDVALVHLCAARPLLEQRLAARHGHFMPAGLLASQLQTLEPPAADEGAISVDVAPAPAAIVATICRELQARWPAAIACTKGVRA